MDNPRYSIRVLARELGLSRTTVSDALRGRGRVDPETAERVRQAAAAVDFRVNPLTGSVMSALRRAQAHVFHGTLAVVDVHEPDRLPHGPFHERIVAGLRQRAGELGFGVEEFVTGPRTLSLQRLDSILQARGASGVVILPSWYPPDLTGLRWSQYSGVYTDYIIERPSLHSVHVDHYHLIMTALAVLTERGYCRPGLVIERGRDRRIESRQSAAFRAYVAGAYGEAAIPPLITRDYPRLAEEFAPWFKHHQPDVVLSHFDETIEWMESCGARVPATHGFVILNTVIAQRPCAGFDLQGNLIGARAAEMLVGQILRNERGLPEWPSRTGIPAKWIEGDTVRPRRIA